MLRQSDLVHFGDFDYIGGLLTSDVIVDMDNNYWSPQDASVQAETFLKNALPEKAQQEYLHMKTLCRRTEKALCDVWHRLRCDYFVEWGVPGSGGFDGRVMEELSDAEREALAHFYAAAVQQSS